MQSGATNSFQNAKKEAHGRWGFVISSLYGNLFSEAMNNPGVSRCGCPNHPSDKAKPDGFRFFQDFEGSGGGVCNTCGSFSDGFDLIQWMDSCTPFEALCKVEEVLGIERKGKKPTKHPQRKLPQRKEVASQKVSETDIAKRDELLERMWSESIPLTELDEDHQAVRYLMKTRGINSLAFVKDQKMIRFHPELYYSSDTEEATKLPGLVSMFHKSDGQVNGLHRTFLDPVLPNKADVKIGKKMLSRLGEKVHGAIRLYGHEGFSSHINICEGLETGGAISVALGKSVMATTTASLLGIWVPLKGVTHVSIWADYDHVTETGAKASSKLADRLNGLGISTRILMPHQKDRNYDWADAYNDIGAEKLRSVYQVPFHN